MDSRFRGNDEFQDGLINSRARGRLHDETQPRVSPGPEISNVYT
jgi:hypothetical protein